jgi:phenylalanyl-tRNA synthetase alpha subunit
MSISIAEVEESAASALSAIAGAKDLAELKVVKIEHLGDKSGLSKASQALGKVAAEEKATFGKIVGEAKAKVLAAFEARIKVLEADRDARVLIEERVDVTLPATNIPKGGLHPLTILTNEISDLFLGLGYRVCVKHSCRPSSANNAGHIFYRAARFKVGSANSYLTGSNSNNAREQAANLCYLSRTHISRR